MPTTRFALAVLLVACAPAPEPLPTDLAAAPILLVGDDLVPGQPATFVVTGAPPSSMVWLAGVRGLGGSGPCLPQDPCLDLGPGAVPILSRRADSTGTARITLTVPTVFRPGQQVTLQAAVLGTPSPSNTITERVLSGLPGLTERPANPTCLAPPRPPSSATGQLTRVFAGVSLSAPTQLAQPPGDSSWWYAIELDGRVKRFPNVNNTTTVQTVLDISGPVASGGELGLLSLAFHPDYATNGELYLYYTTGSPSSRRSRISRVTTTNGGASFGSEVTLLEVDQPFDNHNGGTLQFHPDGTLWFGFGDGGSANDPGNRAQDPDTLLGKMIRIDVDGGFPYAIPPGNPYAGGGGLPEIAAIGLRNPYRWSIDEVTGQAWVGDVGQNAFEEISLVDVGDNLGWRIMEGTRCANVTAGAPPCNDPVYRPPVWELPHPAGSISVIGGHVYRGDDLADLGGAYVYAEFYTGSLSALFTDPTTGARSSSQLVAQPGLQISALVEDENDEILVLAYDGSIRRLTPAGAPTGAPPPTYLSETGCMDATDPSLPGPGLVPYAPRVELWSDGLAKTRWLALPDGSTIDVEADGDWTLPVGSVLVKQFAWQGEPVETRLMARHDDGTWGAWTYRWLADGSDAVLLTDGATLTLPGRTWVVPTQADCFSCHTSAAGFTLGLETAQLNQPLLYGSVWAQQLATFEAIGLLSAPLGASHDLPALAKLDSSSTDEDRARATLHANCAMCHRPGGGGLSDMDLRWQTPLANTATCNVVPSGATGTLVDPRRIRPGDAANSVLWARMATTDPTLRMPQLGTRVVHAAARDVVGDWIDALTACP